MRITKSYQRKVQKPEIAAEKQPEQPLPAITYPERVDTSHIPQRLIVDGISKEFFIQNIWKDINDSLDEFSEEQKVVVMPLLKSISGVYWTLAFNHGKVLVGLKRPSPYLLKEIDHIQMQARAIGLAEFESVHHKMKETVESMLKEGFKIGVQIITDTVIKNVADAL